MKRPYVIAGAWAGVALVGAMLVAVRLWVAGDLRQLPAHVGGALFFIPLWALLTEAVFRCVERARLRTALDGLRYALGFAIFFLVTNAIARVPFFIAHGARDAARDLVAGLTEFAPPAALAFAVIVVLAHVLQKAPAGAPEVLSIADRGATHLVPLAEILWLEAEDNYVLVHTAARTYTARQKIGDLEARLSPASFLRVHRSSLVRADAVRAVRPLGRGDFEVVLADGTAVRGARSRRAAVDALLGA